ncbi:unnamed protein product [Plutella xylostella]|uniref:(diamondback moth) hypothetical protein n=1 Tax=Plutella xylostella TaxID=51655 RepID=A0A8S4FRM0_PLUXY|nr:unnamed protein product [Plutella xylostella]
MSCEPKQALNRQKGSVWNRRFYVPFCSMQLGHIKG